jgi:hypothetical protein
VAISTGWTISGADVPAGWTGSTILDTPPPAAGPAIPGMAVCVPVGTAWVVGTSMVGIDVGFSVGCPVAGTLPVASGAGSDGPDGATGFDVSEPGFVVGF